MEVRAFVLKELGELLFELREARALLWQGLPAGAHGIVHFLQSTQFGTYGLLTSVVFENERGRKDGTRRTTETSDPVGAIFPHSSH